MLPRSTKDQLVTLLPINGMAAASICPVSGYPTRTWSAFAAQSFGHEAGRPASVKIVARKLGNPEDSL